MSALLASSSRRGPSPTRSFPGNAGPDSTGEVRWRLVASIRKQIAEGNYDNAERLDAAMDKLLADLEA